MTPSTKNSSGRKRNGLWLSRRQRQGLLSCTGRSMKRRSLSRKVLRLTGTAKTALCLSQVYTINFQMKFRAKTRSLTSFLLQRSVMMRRMAYGVNDGGFLQLKTPGVFHGDQENDNKIKDPAKRRKKTAPQVTTFLNDLTALTRLHSGKR